MRALAVPRRPLDALALAAGAWRWWIAELRGLLPRRLLDLLNARQSRIVVEMTPEEVSVTRRRAGSDTVLLRVGGAAVASAAPAALRGAVSAGETVILRLPQPEVLRKTVELPLGALRNLRQILRFEVERQSPLDPERVYFDHHVLRRDTASRKLVIELRIVRRDAVDRALAACRSLGLAPASLDFIGDDRPLEIAEIRAAGGVSAARWPWRRVTVALAALACLLVASLAYVESARRQQLASDIAARLAAAKAEAQETDRLRKDIAALAARTEFLDQQKAKPLAIRIVSEITRLLPDGTWLFQLEINGPKIRIRGDSPAASQLLAAFDGSPLFTNTRFLAPVTQGARGGLERFDLSFDYRGEPP
jgi:general secretion pathway protein L